MESRSSVESKSLDEVSLASEKKSKWTAVKDAFTMKKMFAKHEERPTPSAIYNYRLYGTALVASFAAIIIGYDSGFIGGSVALDSFRNEFGLNSMSADSSGNIVSNIISVFHAGCFFGALFSYPFAYYLGRRMSLIIAATLMVAGSAVMLAANSANGLVPIYLGRVLTGLAAGMSTNLTPVYLSEISPPSTRGQIISIYEVGWRIGDLAGFWINYGVDSTIAPSKKQWFIPFAVQLIPSAMFFFGSVFMKESPRWLFSANKDEKAMKNLMWFRKLDAGEEYLAYEVNQIKSSIDLQRVQIGLKIWDPFKEVFIRNRRLLKRLGITQAIFAFQGFLGIQSINYYSPVIFKNLGVGGNNASLFSTGMFGVVKFFCTFIYILFIVDNVGRTKSMMASSTVCSLCFWYIGAYLKLNDPTQPGVEGGPGGKAAIAMMYIWTASFILAWSAGPFICGSEVFDQNIRAFVQAINAALMWVPIFIMSRYTSKMIDAMGYGIYFFFASVAVVSVPFIFFLLPETKGIALEDMDRLFDGRTPAYKAHKIVFAEAKARAQSQLHPVEFPSDDRKSHEIVTIERA